MTAADWTLWAVGLIALLCVVADIATRNNDRKD